MRWVSNKAGALFFFSPPPNPRTIPTPSCGPFLDPPLDSALNEEVSFWVRQPADAAWFFFFPPYVLSPLSLVKPQQPPVLPFFLPSPLETFEVVGVLAFSFRSSKLSDNGNPSTTPPPLGSLSRALFFFPFFFSCFSYCSRRARPSCSFSFFFLSGGSSLPSFFSGSAALPRPTRSKPAPSLFSFE